jgi:hypothetical protein
MTSRIQVCIVTYFQEWRVSDWSKRLKDLASEFASSLNIHFTHFSCNYKGEASQLKKNKTYQFLGRNLTKLDMVSKERELTTLCYVSSPKADVIHNTEVAVLGDSETGYRPYRRIYLEFPLSHIESYNHKAKAEFLFSLMEKIDEIADIQYGFIGTMEQDKLPGIYFGDIGVSTLASEEDLNLQTWLTRRSSYASAIRSIYMANLLGRGHIGRIRDQSQFIKGLKALLGADHVRVLSSGKIYFDLIGKPTDSAALHKLLEKFE